MQWAVEYQIASGTIWLHLFRANSDEEAQAYIKSMCTLFPGHTNMSAMSATSECHCP